MSQPGKNLQNHLYANTLIIMNQTTARRATLALTATTVMKKLKFHKSGPPGVNASNMMQYRVGAGAKGVTRFAQIPMDDE